MKEFLLNFVASSLESIGESKLVEVLQKLHDSNRDQYLAALLGGRALVFALDPLADTTKTQIDDAIISSLKDAINRSALANGIDLDFEAAAAAK